MESPGLHELAVDKYYCSALSRYIAGHLVADRRKIFMYIRRNRERPPREVFGEILSRYQRRNISRGRARSRATEIKQLLPHNFAPRRYLDFGCGDGSITAEVGRAIGAKAYGYDPVFGGCLGVERVLDLETLREIDLVTALVVLHHLAEPKKYITAIRQVMSDGGILIVREHDYTGDRLERVFLDLIHIFAEAAAGESPGFAEYNSKYSWNKLIISCGFRLEATHIRRGSNPQMLYYAIYVAV